jgi:hypothetical protein
MALMVWNSRRKFCTVPHKLIELSASSSESEAESDAPKRKRKGNQPSKPRKRTSTSQGKDKGKATATDSDSEQGIRVTAKSEKRRTGGMFVDEIVHIYAVPESWNVPASSHRLAYVVDLTDTPELLGSGHDLITVDKYIKQEVV